MRLAIKLQGPAAFSSIAASRKKGRERAGIFSVQAVKVYSKINYYDKKLEHGSEDPADQEQTTHAMTILPPSEDAAG